MSKSAWLSIGKTQSALSIRTFKASIELYGLVITSSSLLGNTHVENLNTSGYSSARSCKIYVPKPEPVPPPSECKKKKPCNESHCSVAYLTFYSIDSLYLGPYSIWPWAQLFPAPDPTWSVMIIFWSNRSLSSPPNIFLSMTPLSMSTITERAFRSFMRVPV